MTKRRMVTVASHDQLGVGVIFGWGASWHPLQTSTWAATCSAHEHGWHWADRLHFIFFLDSKEISRSHLPASQEHISVLFK